jgi:hypothetical protein
MYCYCLSCATCQPVASLGRILTVPTARSFKFSLYGLPDTPIFFRRKGQVFSPYYKMRLPVLLGILRIHHKLDTTHPTHTTHPTRLHSFQRFRNSSEPVRDYLNPVRLRRGQKNDLQIAAHRKVTYQDYAVLKQLRQVLDNMLSKCCTTELASPPRFASPPISRA